MTNKNTESDTWGQLLSDFGIEDQAHENITKPEEPKMAETSESPTEQPKVPPKPTPSDHFGAGLVNSEAEIVEYSPKLKEKKSIFSRFPKINFFGAPPEVSLDSVLEGTKSSSLGGKAFTDNKLEKMPFSSERTDRQQKNAMDNPDTWAVVASQIDVLASGGELKTPQEERSSKRRVSSMFDDPIPESDEFRALKDLMGEQTSQGGTHRAAFLDEGSDSRRNERGRRPSPPEEKEVRGRGSRYKPPVEVDDLPESDFEPMDDEISVAHGRGQRGSRYTGEKNRRGRNQIQNNTPQEEWSELDAALQANQGEQTQRGERYPRHEKYDKRRKQERIETTTIDRELSTGEDSGAVIIHGNILSWDEAVGDIIAGNIARHKSSHSGRGRR